MASRTSPSATPELGPDVLVAWLRTSSDHWAASTRLHRTRIIDRFLDHLVQAGAIDRSPVVALREACNIKRCMPVWRALGSDTPDRALAELRQPRPFGSVLGGIMAEHVALMRNRATNTPHGPCGSCGSIGSCS